jgi:hypothetical protein
MVQRFTKQEVSSVQQKNIIHNLKETAIYSSMWITQHKWLLPKLNIAKAFQYGNDYNFLNRLTEAKLPQALDTLVTVTRNSNILHPFTP